ncbi:unnamed protein product [Oikopleura dioica]|uniref:Uncharacterized protein n=1 Tax=Oikopleura dioica TaxID=34765 RepID=E4YPD9_OIKDI|nr:unnamed protein product [Oikopleura dioica]
MENSLKKPPEPLISSVVKSQIIKPTFSASIFDEQFLASLDTQIGFMGTMMVVAGLVGAILGGAVLDRFKKFKLTANLVEFFL